MAFYQFEDGKVYQLNHEPSGAKRLTKAEGERLVRQQAIDMLRDILKPGDTVYCFLKHVSRSGMMRHIQLLTGEGKSIRDITALASDATGISTTEHGALKVGGCGMDMGFHAVYSLGRAMYREGFKLPKGAYGRNGDTSGFDRDGGYAFRHSWL